MFHSTSPFPTFLLISLSLTSLSHPNTLPSLCANYPPKRLQASLLNNRSNQLPSLPLPLLCAPLLHSLFQQRVQREDNFSKQQCWEESGRGRRKENQKEIKKARGPGSRWFKESRGTSDNTTLHADVCCLKPRQANKQLLYNP